jgi:hypothetical protein
MRRPLPASWALIAADVAIVALTNADALIDDVHRALPWTYGGYCDIWSARFFLVAIAVSAAALVLAVVARRRPDTSRGPARAAMVVATLLLLYWLTLAFLKTMSMCVE